jgi:hypothetical protein
VRGSTEPEIALYRRRKLLILLVSPEGFEPPTRPL